MNAGEHLQQLLHARDGYLVPALWLLVVVIALTLPSLLQRFGGRR